MAQAIILAAIKFGGIFGVTNLSPIMGVGSQMLPKNVWANPSLWPFAFVDRELATDISTLIALAVFVVACYVMARCFDMPVVPSAISAQLCIVLFAPALLLVYMPTNFCLTPRTLSSMRHTWLRWGCLPASSPDRGAASA